MTLNVGDVAPDFSVPLVHENGHATLAEYRGRRGVLVGLYRGLHCPFCRRHLAQMNLVRARLEALGVATLAIVNTPLDRARLYFRNDGKGMRIGADPERRVHEAWAVPKLAVVAPESRTAPWPVQTTIDEFLGARINPTGEMPAAVNPIESNDVLNAIDGFQMTPADEHIRERHGTQLVGLFLLDRDGIVRWRYVEAETSPNDIGRIPGLPEIVEAASRLPTRDVA
jgi:peroxiredoxin